MKNLFILCTCFIVSLPLLSAQVQFSALLVTKTAGWHHESIREGVGAIQQLAVRNAFSVQWHQAGVTITPKYLQQFQVIIFLNTTGDILNEGEQQAVEQFIRSGKGFVGIHSASDTEYNWPWYTKMVGRMFQIHPAIQTAKLRKTENSFPGLEGFTDGQWWTDEWYEFGPELIPDLQYILAVDESTYNPVVEWADKKSREMEWVRITLSPGFMNTMEDDPFTLRWATYRQFMTSLHFKSIFMLAFTGPPLGKNSEVIVRICG